MPKVFSSADDELYARIVWGDHTSDLCDWLMEKGLPREVALDKIKETKARLREEARRAAIKEIGRGIVIALSSGVGLVLWAHFSGLSLSKIHWTEWANEFGSYTVLGIAIGALDILVGIFRLITGTEGLAPSDHVEDYAGYL